MKTSETSLTLLVRLGVSPSLPLLLLQSRHLLLLPVVCPVGGA